MFKNRIDAGEQLAKKLEDYSKKKNTVVLGIPRGGVVVASIVSKILELPLDIMVIKKLGLPGNEEFAIGAAGPEMFHVDENKVKEFKTIGVNSGHTRMIARKTGRLGVYNENRLSISKELYGFPAGKIRFLRWH